MRTAGFKGVLVATATLLVAAPIALSAEKFIPDGHLWSPDNTPIPPLNSPGDYINNRSDVYQSEIYRRQYDLQMFDTEMDRFIDHDLINPGPASGPSY